MSTITMMTVLPCELGSFSMNFMETSVQILSGKGKGCRRPGNALRSGPLNDLPHHLHGSRASATTLDEEALRKTLEEQARAKKRMGRENEARTSAAKVITIEESKDLTSLSLDELIRNLKVHEMIVKKDSEIVKAKGERKSLALKAKKESSDEECSTSGSKDKEYAMANGKGDRKCFRCGDPNHLIGECPKPPKDKNQRAFVRGSWSDSSEEDDEKVKDETCLMAQARNESTWNPMSG
ncbi:zf-CCHC domain-containing protein [Tanacetum coccineum]